MKRYYDSRATEYDATSWDAFRRTTPADVEHVLATVAALAPARVLDVACGTGYLTAHLRGEVVGVDQSAAMLELAAARVPGATLVRADVPPLPFGDDTFDRVLTSSFYSHLETPELRAALVAEALRVAPELIVVDEAWRPGLPEQGWEDRVLADGTTWQVFKRYWTAEGLRRELRGEVLLATDLFLVVRTGRS